MARPVDGSGRGPRAAAGRCVVRACDGRCATATCRGRNRCDDCIRADNEIGAAAGCAFIDECVRQIEAAMRAHCSDVTLQTKGARAMSCAIAWPEDLQRQSGYDVDTAVDLTKTAMASHGSAVELQQACLEALAKYLDKLRCVDAVSAQGGEGLVKAMMARHMADDKVQTWGKIVLDGLGIQNWAPRGMAAERG